MLLKSVKKDIDDIRSPSNRILITLLVIVVGVLAGVHHNDDVVKDEKNDAVIKKQQEKIDRLEKSLETITDSDYTRAMRTINLQNIYLKKYGK